MVEQPTAPVDQATVFGPFRLFAAQRLLLEGEKPLRLGSRALEILTVLVENPGALVTKEELVARVWPDTFVEEGNLRVHMAALRRVLGDGQAGNRYVATIPGRGYRFVAAVSISEDPRPEVEERPPLQPVRTLPSPLTRMIGRADIVEAIVAQLPQRRFITIVGPGGIGKTTVAIAVADALSAAYKDRAALVDLALLSDPALVPGAIAAVLGLPIRSENPVPAVISFLSGKNMLLVLDSCEHVIDAVAVLSEQIRQAAAGVHVLATSREPLRAAGERLYRLSPLKVPASSEYLTASDALSYPAIQLFVERAAATFEGFELNDANAPVVAEICRRLDGIALAIELAAGRIDAFGVRELAARLDDRFRLLNRGRRTALPRHQTLSTTLDWSYELLPESERLVLRRLAVFAGTFTLEAANAVISDAEQVTDRVANLVAKSLLTADIGSDVVQYRLLETTRAYALEKLTDSGELRTFAERHALYFRDLFRRAAQEWEKQPPAEWLDAYGGHVDNIRAALEWAFSPSGNAEIGVALTIAAAPLWLQLSLINECRRQVERALAVAATQLAPDVYRDLQLSAALGSVLIYTSMGPEARRALTRALETAERLGDVDYTLRSLWGLWIDRLNNGGFQEALALARRFYATASNSVDPVDPLMGERMIGIALHFLGGQVEARQHIERMLGRYVSPVYASHVVRFQFDQRVTARSFHARILWLLGYPDEATRIIEETVEEAVGIGHVLSLCNALGQGACPIALFTGDLAAAERYLNMLLDYSGRHAIAAWHTWAQCFRGALLLRRGESAAALQALSSVLGEAPEFRRLPRYLALFAELADAMSQCGGGDAAAEEIDAALDRAERNEERWCIAELLRIKGDILVRRGGADDAAAAESCFDRSLGWARRQSTLSWELRAAISLARLKRDHGEPVAARALLAPVYGRFTEGFATADLMAAKALLDELS